MSAWTGPLRTGTSLSVWEQVKEAAVPITLYWLAVLFAITAFCASILISDGFNGENVAILIAFVVSTVLGVGLGQLLAFLRIRTWVLLFGGGISWAIFFTAVATTTAVGMPDPIGIFLVAVLFLGPIAMTGGLWSLETHRALWSTWLPLVYAVGAIIAWSEFRGNDAAWFAGNKWAIWDLASFGVLGGELVFLMGYLVTRETHRLALWKRGPMAPLQPLLKETGQVRPRITLGGCAVLLVLTGVLAVATALVAPYLWRTGPGDRPDDTPMDQTPDEQKSPDQGDSELMKRLQQVAEQMAEAAKDAGGVVCGGMTALLLLTILALGLYRPLRRLFLVRHLREPFWSVSRTARIEQGWKLVEIALGDVGVHPHPGEDAAGLARRAAPVLQELSPVEVHGLEDAAAVADRVRFGLGVTPEDERVMERFSRWVHDTVWERMGDLAQLQAMYRGI